MKPIFWERMLSLPCGLVCGVALLLSLCYVGSAQVPDPVTTAMAPQPGDGHHYIGVGAETVNPADGSLTFDLPINTPPGRGLNFPFGIRYSSPEQFKLMNNGWINAATSGQLIWNGWSGGNLPYQAPGWQYELPSLVVQYGALFSGTVNPGGTLYTPFMFQCDAVNNYVFRGFDGREYPLMIAQMIEDPTDPLVSTPGSPDGVPGSYTLNICNPATVNVSNTHGVLATAQIVTGSPGIPIDGANVNVYDQSGTEYQFGGFTVAGGTGPGIPTIGSTPQVQGVLASTITDRNGNQITKTAGGYQDALGRNVITFGSFESSANDSITVAGLSSPVIVQWENNNPTFPISGNVIFGSTYDTADFKNTGDANIFPATVPYVNCNEGAFNSQSALVGSSGAPSQIPYSAIKEIDIPAASGGTQSYKFQYEPNYGHISQINFPDGGYVTYTWGLNTQSTATVQQYTYTDTWACDGSTGNCLYYYPTATCIIDLDLPAITERDVSYDGVNVALRQTFSYSTTWSSASQWSSKQTVVTTKDLTAPGTPVVSVTTYTYGYVPADTAPFTTQSWLANQVPVEQKIVYADGSGNTLKTVYDTWLNSTTKLGEQTVLDNNGPGSAVERCYDANEQVTNVFEYGFQSQGAKPSDPLCYSTSIPISTSTSLYSSQSLMNSSIGPLLRQTTTSYSPFFNPAFAPNYQSMAKWTQTTHIVNAPLSIAVADGSGNPLKKTTFTYTDVTSKTGAINLNQTLPGTKSSGHRGNIGSMTQINNNGGSETTNYLWWDTGLLNVKIDPMQNHTFYYYADKYTYSSCGSTPGPSGLTAAYLTSVTDALNYTRMFAWDYCAGLLTSATDENNNKTFYTYSDPLGRLTQVTYPDNTTGNPSISVVYNDSPYSPSTNCTQNSTGTPNYTVTTLSTPNPSAVKETAFDGMGHALRTILTSDPSGADCVDTTYDGLGRVASVTNPYRATDSPVGVTKYTYDALGRKIVQTQPDSSTLLWCYDDIPASNTISSSNCHPFLGTNPKVPVGTWVDSADENGNDWQRNSNGLGQMTVVMEPGGTSQATPGLAPSMETDYAYDPLNNLLGVAQWGGSSNNSSNARLRSFSYDNLSQLQSAFNPETGTVSYSYDLDGNVTFKTDARGISTFYQYDPLNRVISKTYPTDTSGTPISCFQYDTSSIPGATSGAAGNMIGRLSNAWIQATTTSCSGTAPNYAPATGSYLTLRSILAYDAMGRILSENQYTPATIASNTPYALQYTYDLMGNLWTSTSGAGPGGTPSNPFGTPLAFTNLYNGASRLLTLQSSWTNGSLYPALLFLSPTYAAFGGLQNATYGNGVLNLNRSYDVRMRLISEVDNGTGITPGTSGSAAVTITGQEQSQ